MTLENLLKIKQLHSELADKREFDGLVNAHNFPVTIFIFWTSVPP